MELIALALGAGLALATPAYAADIKTLNCITEGVDAPLKLSIEQFVRDEFAEMRQDGTPPFIAGLVASGETCVKRFGWSKEARIGATAYTLAVIAMPTARDELRKKGVDPDRMTALFNAMPPEVREMPFDKMGDEPPAEFSDMMAKASDEGLVSTPEQQQAVVHFLVYLFMQGQGKAMFLRS